MPMCQEHNQIPYCTPYEWATGQTDTYRYTHTLFNRAVVKRYQTISLKLLTFPISLLSLFSITGCGSSSVSCIPENCERIYRQCSLWKWKRSLWMNQAENGRHMICSSIMATFEQATENTAGKKIQSYYIEHIEKMHHLTH